MQTRSDKMGSMGPGGDSGQTSSTFDSLKIVINTYLSDTNSFDMAAEETLYILTVIQTFSGGPLLSVSAHQNLRFLVSLWTSLKRVPWIPSHHPSRWSMLS